jgi:signal transduction histidine kinase
MTDGKHGNDRPGLARTISVVGLTISQAADELQQAAERLVAAEEQAREAELRTQAAEEQLAQSAAKISELLGMVEAAREQAAESEERARRAEARLQAAEEQRRELDRRVAELQARLAEAEARPTVIVDEEHGALKEAIAAEVRRPLTSILGITLALKHTDSKSPDGREMIRQLATHARKLDRLVGEMLEIDRIAAGTYVPNVRRTDLEALVWRVTEECSDLANRDVEIRTDHVALHVDPGLAEQMVETLLANAGRRTVPGSTVWISVTAAEGGAVIAVDDSGPEVPEQVRRALLAGDGDTGASGRGRGAAGLSLLARLAEIHGGRCWVEDRPGGGVSFRVFLPDGVPARQAEQEARAETPAPPRREPDERALALARALREPVGDEELPV